jgi:transposase
LRAAVEAIVDKHRVCGLLQVEYRSKTKTIHKRAYGRRPAQTLTKDEVTVPTALDPTAYQDAVHNLGGRGYVCNDMELSLSEAVLAYREEYLVERCPLQGQNAGAEPALSQFQ